MKCTAIQSVTKSTVCVCGGCSAGANILYALTLGTRYVCSHSAALRKLTKYAHVNNKVKTVSEHDFLLLVKSAPALLFPVFRLQQQVGTHCNTRTLVSHKHTHYACLHSFNHMWWGRRTGRRRLADVRSMVSPLHSGLPRLSAC